MHLLGLVEGTWFVHLLGKQADDPVQGAADATRESGEDGDRADRDHGEDDTVLRHRLTLLLAPMRPEKLKPLGKRHGIVTSLPFTRARRPAHYKLFRIWIEGCGVRRATPPNARCAAFIGFGPDDGTSLTLVIGS